MIKNKTIIVAKSCHGSRLDKFIALQFPHISRRTIQSAIREEMILLNKKTGKKGIMLEQGDIVEIKEMLEPSDMLPAANPDLSVDIIHEDENIIIVDKPAGMPSHPLSPAEKNTVVNFILHRYPNACDFGYSPLEPAILHRLDINTSGLLMSAKNPAAFEKMKHLMSERLITKTYLAIVTGNVEKDGVIDTPLKHHDKDKRKMTVCKSKKDKVKGAIYQAETEYRAAKHFNGYTLLEVRVKSAVMHQIRCHLSSINHPISGDRLYQSPRQKKNDTLAPERHLLHAWKILIPEEFGTAALNAEAPLPEDFKNCISYLEKTKT